MDWKAPYFSPGSSGVFDVCWPSNQSSQWSPSIINPSPFIPRISYMIYIYIIYIYIYTSYILHGEYYKLYYNIVHGYIIIIIFPILFADDSRPTFGENSGWPVRRLQLGSKARDARLRRHLLALLRRNPAPHMRIIWNTVQILNGTLFNWMYNWLVIFNHLETYESQWEGWHPIYYGK